MSRDKLAKEEALYAARRKVAWETKEEDMKSLEEEKKEEERHRLLAQRLQELEKREVANNLKVKRTFVIFDIEYLTLQYKQNF